MFRSVLFAICLTSIASAERFSRTDWTAHFPDGDFGVRSLFDPDAYTAGMIELLGGKRPLGGTLPVQQNGDCILTYSSHPEWNLSFCGVRLDSIPQYEPDPALGVKFYVSGDLWGLVTSSDDVKTFFYLNGQITGPYPVTLDSYVTYDMAGDFTRDGSIDAADAALMFADWGGPSRYSLTGHADAAGAGFMFERWTGDSFVVPEPGIIPVLLLLGTQSLVMFRR